MSLRHLTLTLALVGLAACSVNPAKTTTHLTPEEAVAQRAAERWQYLVDKDYAAAYEYFTPGSRAVMSYESFALRMAHSQVKYIKADVTEVVCEEEGLCKAKVSLDYSVHVSGVGELATTLKRSEDWLETNRQWYYLSPDVL